ncbi:MAG: BNR repeat-containing protein [Opitutaceae bacterium]|nr:BNR repeat-containing protein [Opitutaceae bacterium]
MNPLPDILQALRTAAAATIAILVATMTIAETLSLPNPGFEDELSGWTAPRVDAGKSRVTAEAAHTGKLGLLVVDDDDQGGSELHSTKLPATEGDRIRIHFQARIIAGRGMTTCMVFYDKNGTALNAAKHSNEILIQLDPRFTEWHACSFDGIAPANTATVGIRLHSINNARVTAHLDDFSIERVDEAAEARQQAAIAAQHKQPIPETRLAGWRRTHPDLKLDITDIDLVCSDFRVGLTLLTRPDRQYAAYYNPRREMTIAWRALDTTRSAKTTWQTKSLPSRVAHDSHNNIVLGFDRDGGIHVSGNMHATPLVYFRTTRPDDPTSLEPMHRMTGTGEEGVTYPRFENLPDGRLVYSYRQGHGHAGKYETIFNVYDEPAKTWKRLLPAPLFDGENARRAYPIGPTPGPDGNYHLTWVWRTAPFNEASTNNNLGYLRSANFIDWTTIDGKPVPLPITINTPGVIVDPIPDRGGIINGTGLVGFDANNRLLITYHKYDADGKTQMFIATHENGAWKHTQATQWDYRWDFHGDGSIPYEIHIGKAGIIDGRLGAFIRHPRFQGGFHLIDPATLKLGKRVPASEMPWNHTPLPDALNHPQSPVPGMQVNWAQDTGTAIPGTLFSLRWETLPANRDKPYSLPSPPPSTMLRLVTVQNNAGSR